MVAAIDTMTWCGIVTNTPYNETGGHTVTIQHDNGYKTQYMHLSEFVVGDDTRANAGDIVRRSGGAAGAPGSGSCAGPHLYWHMINPDGVRVSPLDYVDGTTPSPSSPPIGPVHETASRNSWQPIPVDHNDLSTLDYPDSCRVR